MNQSINQSTNQSDGTTFSRFISAFLLVWTSPGGYNHSHTGQKVAQIQVVLARRCAVIGELQQHLFQTFNGLHSSLLVAEIFTARP